ncbi:acetyltransferase (GNAT) family protein [Marinilabilia salmonicolor]|jgi:predicted acetyltransferase|uniref:GNAT family N-acetyltransferase n=1 Tax=Marinilabilia salmonicolor TaxID=989 RepID=UPI000D075AC3|nr:GNAT family N-acetyltransferase [Marinilabilia salmonicolor]PRY99948.1 acetyltransferase (GNAT) family protein [Marinilabilia salmonicolor]
MKFNILEVSRQNGLIDKAVDYFWNCWGNDNNFNFYKDCIAHSLDAEKGLPGFYVVLNHSEIIASYALLVNDLISRQDLLPWLACLYVDEKYRNKGIAEQLLKHGLKEARGKGYDKLYLSTDLEGFYEKYGWSHFADGFNIVNVKMKIYAKSTL